MEHVITFSDFRFKTLRKFMTPLYNDLQAHPPISAFDKESFVSLRIREFFKRVRFYREVSFVKIAEAAFSQIDIADLEKFESGEGKCTRLIQDAYCRACGCSDELHYFSEQLRAFFNPSIRESSNAIAKDLLKRFGVMMPLVDYKNLNAEKGKVLEFRR
jgi:hypothetical protein